MKRIIAALAIALALASPVAAHSLPEVAVTVFVAPDGYQMEWDGDVLAEHGEEWCDDTYCVNETLTRIGQEWTYSVAWKAVAP